MNSDTYIYACEETEWSARSEAALYEGEPKFSEREEAWLRGESKTIANANANVDTKKVSSKTNVR